MRREIKEMMSFSTGGKDGLKERISLNEMVRRKKRGKE